MRCEAHVRFLGGGGAVMRCRYPTLWVIYRMERYVRGDKAEITFCK